VPREVCGEHLTIRSPAVSSTLPTVSATRRDRDRRSDAVRGR
jgi:hypothetical protein